MATSDDKFLTGDSPSEEVGDHIVPASAPPTGGDMLKSVYDTDDDGKVGSAQTADTATNSTNATNAVTVTGVSGSGLSHYYGTNIAGTEGVFPLPILSSSAVFTGLTDTPANYSGASLLGLRVNSGETALEFAAFITTFLALTDVTPTSYTGKGLQGVRVNAGETGLEFAAAAAAADEDAQLLIHQGI